MKAGTAPADNVILMWALIMDLGFLLYKGPN